MKLNCKKIKLKTQDGNKGVSEQKCMKRWKCGIKEMVKSIETLKIQEANSHMAFHTSWKQEFQPSHRTRKLQLSTCLKRFLGKKSTKTWGKKNLS
jgi:hypothetical protein